MRIGQSDNSRKTKKKKTSEKDRIKKSAQSKSVEQALEESSNELYIYNMSTLIPGMESGSDINIPIVSSDGNQRLVDIKNTFIPIKLTDFASKEDILRNPNFRSYVSRNIIKIVDSKHAVEVLKGREERRELDRLISERNSIIAGNSSGMGELSVSDEEANYGNEISDAEIDRSKIKPIIVENMERNDISDAERFNNIKLNEASLDWHDCMYILSKCDESTDDDLVKFVRNKLNE